MPRLSRVRWDRPKEDYVKSKCKRFNIEPRYCGSTRPQFFGLYDFKAGKEVATGPTQRSCKEAAEEIGPDDHPAQVVCLRDNQSARFHTTSWSHQYTCPTCEKSRRYNANFLGNKYEVVCDGYKIGRRMRTVWVERMAARIG